MGDPHEIWNKKYFSKKIAEEIADVVLKVNCLSYDVWDYVEITATPYNYCSFIKIDVIDSMGVPCMQLDTLEPTGFQCEIKWSPGNVNDKKIPIAKGSTIKLEKRIDTFFVHPMETSGTLKLVFEGYEHWDC
jgi:hypothetical protein